jgi:hypothetical protein
MRFILVQLLKSLIFQPSMDRSGNLHPIPVLVLSVTAQDRLEHSPALDASSIGVTLSEAYAKLGVRQPRTGSRKQVRRPARVALPRGPRRRRHYLRGHW